MSLRDSLNLPRPARRQVKITDLTDEALQLIGQYVTSSGVAPPLPSSYVPIAPRRTSTIIGYHEGSYRRDSDRGATIDGWSGPRAGQKAEETREYWASRMGSGYKGKDGYEDAASKESARERAMEGAISPTARVSPSPYRSPSVYSNRLIPDPRALLPLMLTCRTFNKALQFEHNPELYRWLYLETFDSEALIRRWKSYQKGGLNHGYRSVRCDIHPDEPHGSTACCQGRRMTDKMGEKWHEGHTGTGCACREGLHLLEDPTILANEYKERFEVFQKFRAIAKAGNMEGIRDTPALREAFTTAIWTMYWMYIEHDRKNLVILEDLACLRETCMVFYREIMFDDALKPGYPDESMEKAILGLIANELGIDLEYEETREQIDAKVFIMLPLVFGVHKYSFLYGPWVHRDLPLTKIARSEEELRLMCRPNAFMDELTPTSKAVIVKRLGKQWKMLPPLNTIAHTVGLMQALERHPELLTLGKSSTVSATGKNLSYVRLNRNPIFNTASPSSRFDMDLNRAMSCASPIDSAGLDPLALRHQLEGLWEGKYLYFDYHAYQHVVKGDVRSLYEGTYGCEVLEWVLEEKVICVRADRCGGDGPTLSAGYSVGSAGDEEEDDHWYPCLDEKAPDRPGWTKEILLSGVGHSPWGKVELKGRVRGWDGLVIIHADYGFPVSSSRWLFRTYLYGGTRLLGRFRDTFTPENMRGYEGPVFFQRPERSNNDASRRTSAATVLPSLSSGTSVPSRADSQVTVKEGVSAWSPSASIASGTSNDPAPRRLSGAADFFNRDHQASAGQRPSLPAEGLTSHHNGAADGRMSSVARDRRASPGRAAASRTSVSSLLLDPALTSSSPGRTAAHEPAYHGRHPGVPPSPPILPPIRDATLYRASGSLSGTSPHADPHGRTYWTNSTKEADQVPLLWSRSLARDSGVKREHEATLPQMEPERERRDSWNRGREEYDHSYKRRRL